MGKPNWLLRLVCFAGAHAWQHETGLDIPPRRRCRYCGLAEQMVEEGAGVMGPLYVRLDGDAPQLSWRKTLVAFAAITAVLMAIAAYGGRSLP